MVAVHWRKVGIDERVRRRNKSTMVERSQLYSLTEGKKITTIYSSNRGRHFVVSQNSQDVALCTGIVDRLRLYRAELLAS